MGGLQDKRKYAVSDRDSNQSVVASSASVDLVNATRGQCFSKTIALSLVGTFLNFGENKACRVPLPPVSMPSSTNHIMFSSSSFGGQVVLQKWQFLHMVSIPHPRPQQEGEYLKPDPLRNGCYRLVGCQLLILIADFGGEQEIPSLHSFSIPAPPMSVRVSRWANQKHKSFSVSRLDGHESAPLTHDIHPDQSVGGKSVGAPEEDVCYNIPMISFEQETELAEVTLHSLKLRHAFTEVKTET
ncbi:hypothetical protein NQZ68_041893 [Dissostichus eleginoides]|nr:hypothetical protein NQZ68_041893 [Dissostichus eleginoides]